MMKKKQKQQLEEDHGHEIEIIKAVAQAWHGHSISSKTTSEFDAHRRNFKSKPTRFKLEATREASGNDNTWDFGQSLWDSYEIVAVSKKLETGLVLDDAFSVLDESDRVFKKQRKESRNTLRSLFNKMSSRRFREDDIPQEERP